MSPTSLRLDGDLSTRMLGFPLAAIGIAAELPERPIAGIPACAVDLKDADLIVACTPCDPPVFREQITRGAEVTGRDIMLVRHGFHPETMNAVTVDVVIHTIVAAASRSGDVSPLEKRPIELHDMIFYRHIDRRLWLVPSRIGPFVEITRAGLRLEATPPFISWSERSDGVCRAAAQIVRLTSGRER